MRVQVLNLYIAKHCSLCTHVYNFSVHKLVHFDFYSTNSLIHYCIKYDENIFVVFVYRAIQYVFNITMPLFVVTRCVVPFFRLGLSGEADTTMEVSLLADTRKKSASLPKHAPPVSTLRHLFTTCLDIREPPKKVCACKCPYMYIIDVLTAR